MKKPLREQLKWKYIGAQCEIEQALRYIKNDGAKQYPSSHRIICDNAIEKLEEIKILIAEQSDPKG